MGDKIIYTKKPNNNTETVVTLLPNGHYWILQELLGKQNSVYLTRYDLEEILKENVIDEWKLSKE